MFGKLREKLSGWFKGKEEKIEEKPKKEKKEKAKKVSKKTEKKIEKEEKKAREKKKSEEKIKEKKVDKSIKKKAEDKTKEDVEAILSEVEKESVTGEKQEAEVREEEKKESFFSKVKKVFVSEEKKEEIEERAEELQEKLDEDVASSHQIEEPLAVEKVGEEIEEKKGFFGRLAQKLTTSELKIEEFDELFEEFEFVLLENNVALAVVDKIKESLKNELVGKKFGKKEVEEKILSALKNAIDSVLIEGESLEEMIKKKDSKDPFVILFFGINGSGKTTSIAKLAYRLKKEGFEPVLAAGDTFRAASIEQLETHANKIGVDIIKGEYGKDPASVAFDAIAHAKKIHKRVVLIDTAGRMYTKLNLMKEMEKIVKVSHADLKVFVGESITGNDAIEQAKMFNETAGIDGIILTKADVDEKAGTILSVGYVTGKPILFLGVGQEYEDLKEFKKEDVLKNLGLED